MADKERIQRIMREISPDVKDSLVELGLVNLFDNMSKLLDYIEGSLACIDDAKRRANMERIRKAELIDNTAFSRDYWTEDRKSVV